MRRAPSAASALPAMSCLLLPLLAATCGDGGVSAMTACNDNAAFYCDRVAQCAPFLLQLAYGDEATCQARFALTCPTSFGAPGTSYTPAVADACARAIKDLACDDILAGVTPAACDVKPGQNTNGTACGSPWQCQSTYCNVATDATCGVCAPRGDVGAACTSNDGCQPGQACAGGKCAVKGAAGAPCDDTHPCGGVLRCKSKVCAVPLALGAACMPLVDLICDATKGLWCNPGTKVCETAQTAKAGEGCGIGSYGVIFCTAGGKCKGETLTAKGTCLGAAADGATCDPVAGPTCAAPAKCVGGACKLEDPAMCK